jgi:hypothetical protein
MLSIIISNGTSILRVNDNSFGDFSRSVLFNFSWKETEDGFIKAAS